MSFNQYKCIETIYKRLKNSNTLIPILLFEIIVIKSMNAYCIVLLSLYNSDRLHNRNI